LITAILCASKNIEVRTAVFHRISSSGLAKLASNDFAKGILKAVDEVLRKMLMQ